MSRTTRNRNGVRLDSERWADYCYVVYQIGSQSGVRVARIDSIEKYKDGTIVCVRTPNGSINSTYILGFAKEYKPRDIVQTPQEVAYITAARNNGRPIEGRLKTQDEWQLMEGNFQFNFSALEYRVKDEPPLPNRAKRFTT